MGDAPRDPDRLLEEARRAREEADRLRRQARAEAERLKAEARRIREEARRQRQAVRGSKTAPPEEPAARVERGLPPLDGVRSVEIDCTAGRLAVHACAPGEAPGVTAAAKSPPELDIERTGETLRIHIKMPRGWLFRPRQGAAALVRLPPIDLRVLRITNGYGEIEAAGLAAEAVRVSTGAGAVTLLQLRGDLDVSVGAGKISILAHEGTAAAHSGTGDITLDLAAVVPGACRVDVGLGRAEVRLPRGAVVEVRATSGLGKAAVDVPSVPGAPSVIKVNSGIGEAAVRYRAADDETPPARSASPRAAGHRREAEELRVLQLLEQGRITPQEAADLIAALRGMPRPPAGEPEA